MTTNKRFLPTDPAERKKYPMCTGLLDYFPDALAMVAHISYLGNEQHNPGQPLHWARGKSMDQEDTLIRHMVERGEPDVDGAEHMAKAAWRALAALQLELEERYGLSLPRGARNETVKKGPPMTLMPMGDFIVGKGFVDD